MPMGFMVTPQERDARAVVIGGGGIPLSEFFSTDPARLLAAF